MTTVDKEAEYLKNKKKAIGCGLPILAVIAIMFVMAFVITRTNPTYTELEPTAAPLIMALEKYKSEHGRYPDKIAALTPKYLKVLPACPGKKIIIPYFKDEKSDQYELICYGFYTHKLRYRSSTGKWDSYD